MSELAGRIHATMNTGRAETGGLSRQYMSLPAPLPRLNKRDYIVVETAKNQLLFISNSQVVLKAACLTGSGKEFIDPLDSRKWDFDTPRGEFYIASKRGGTTPVITPFELDSTGYAKIVDSEEPLWMKSSASF